MSGIGSIIDKNKFCHIIAISLLVLWQWSQVHAQSQNPYCSSGGDLCDPCVAGEPSDPCPTVDKYGLDSFICVLPTSYNGTVNETSICGYGSPYGARIDTMDLQLPRAFMEPSDPPFVTVGKMVAFMQRNGTLTVTLHMRCPWLIRVDTSGVDRVDTSNQDVVRGILQFPLGRIAPYTVTTTAGLYSCLSFSIAVGPANNITDCDASTFLSMLTVSFLGGAFMAELPIDDTFSNNACTTRDFQTPNMTVQASMAFWPRPPMPSPPPAPPAPGTGNISVVINVVDRPLQQDDPLPVLNGSTIYLDYNYIIITLRFNNTSLYASCDTQIQCALVTLLSVTLKFPAANISTSCLSGAAVSDPRTDNCYPSTLTEITFKLDPATSFSQFKASVYQALGLEQITSGMCSLSPDNSTSTGSVLMAIAPPGNYTCTTLVNLLRDALVSYGSNTSVFYCDGSPSAAPANRAPPEKFNVAADKNNDNCSIFICIILPILAAFMLARGTAWAFMCLRRTIAGFRNDSSEKSETGWRHDETLVPGVGQGGFTDAMEDALCDTSGPATGPDEAASQGRSSKPLQICARQDTPTSYPSVVPPLDLTRVRPSVASAAVIHGSGHVDPQGATALETDCATKVAAAVTDHETVAETSPDNKNSNVAASETPFIMLKNSPVRAPAASLTVGAGGLLQPQGRHHRPSLLPPLQSTNSGGSVGVTVLEEGKNTLSVDPFKKSVLPDVLSIGEASSLSAGGAAVGKAYGSKGDSEIGLPGIQPTSSLETAGGNTAKENGDAGASGSSRNQQKNARQSAASQGELPTGTSLQVPTLTDSPEVEPGSSTAAVNTAEKRSSVAMKLVGDESKPPETRKRTSTITATATALNLYSHASGNNNGSKVKLTRLSRFLDNLRQSVGSRVAPKFSIVSATPLPSPLGNQTGAGPSSSSAESSIKARQANRPTGGASEGAFTRVAEGSITGAASPYVTTTGPLKTALSRIRNLKVASTPVDHSDEGGRAESDNELDGPPAPTPSQSSVSGGPVRAKQSRQYKFADTNILPVMSVDMDIEEHKLE